METPARETGGLRLADGFDGRWMVCDLREPRPDLPVVVVTGIHPEAPQADLRGLGGPTLRLAKPCECGDAAAGVLHAPAAQATQTARRTNGSSCAWTRRGVEGDRIAGRTATTRAFVPWPPRS